MKNTHETRRRITAQVNNRNKLYTRKPKSTNYLERDLQWKPATFNSKELSHRYLNKEKAFITTNRVRFKMTNLSNLHFSKKETLARTKSKLR